MDLNELSSQESVNRDAYLSDRFILNPFECSPSNLIAVDVASLFNTFRRQARLVLIRGSCGRCGPSLLIMFR